MGPSIGVLMDYWGSAEGIGSIYKGKLFFIKIDMSRNIDFARGVKAFVAFVS